MKTLHLVLIVLLGLVSVSGCGGDPPPEITEDVAAEIAAEDKEVVDSESEL